MPRFWKIPKVSSYLRNFPNLKNISFTYSNLGNFPNAWVSGKFSQMPGYLGNLPKCLGIWEIYQKPGYLVNLSNAWVSGKFIKCLGIW